MSRIHDALKKAEEQNVAKFGSAAEAAPVEPSELEFPEIALEVMAGVQPAAAAVAPGVVEKRPPSAGDAFFQNCPKAVWHPTKDALFMVAQDNHAPGLEEFRTLRSKLFQIRAKRPLKTLLISSALPGEGKSFVSANLALAFARQRGGRTLLIDADLRKPRLHELFGAPVKPGLFEYLSGKAEEFDIIQRSPVDDLFFVPGGYVSSSAAELIGNGKLELMIDRLSRLFSWIVIDSSPVIPVSDPTRLAQFSDGVLLVVRAGATPHLVVERAKREFHDAPLLGIVFNQVSTTGNPYYRYKYGEYGRGYGSSEL